MREGSNQRLGNVLAMLKRIVKYLCSAKCIFLLGKAIFTEKELLKNSYFSLKNYGIIYFIEQIKNKLQTLYFSNVDDSCFLEPQRLPDKDYSHIASYMTGYAAHGLPRRVAVCVSSLGNEFMEDIARAIEAGLRELSIETRLLHEDQAIDPNAYDWVMIVAPHEFFSLGPGEKLFKSLCRSKNLLMVNTEQRQSTWFNMAKFFFKKARAVLDINYQTAVQLTNEGFPAYFLPIGYSPYHERRIRRQALSPHALFSHLPPSVRENDEYPYAQRPIDILFVGTNSPRRGAFIGANARLFSEYETFFYMPESDVPLQKNDVRCLNFQNLAGLVRRSKILLNIHHGDNRYFEWQRIVSLGILQGTLVVSESCNETPFVVANEDYVDAPLEKLAGQCLYFLAHPQEAEEMAARAFAKLRSTCPMAEVLGNVFARCIATASVARPG
jgi:hypothetical protein